MMFALHGQLVVYLTFATCISLSILILNIILNSQIFAQIAICNGSCFAEIFCGVFSNL